MSMAEWFLVFFGGGGLVGVGSFFLTKEKQKYDKETMLIDRLAKEINRLDELVDDLRGYVSKSELEKADAKRQLFSEEYKVAQMDILIIKLKEEIRSLSVSLGKISGGRKRKDDKNARSNQ